MSKSKDMDEHHIPVLTSGTLDLLAPKVAESYLDLTAGFGGHARQVLEITKAPKKAVLVDRDAEAVSVLKKKFGQSEVLHSDFLSVSRQLLGEGRQFDMILADLGASSQHFDKASRGFSFRQSGPLDMRMDSSQALTASQVVNKWSEAKLTQILRDYGEEPKAAKIAQKIVRARPISTTDHLAAIIASSAGRRMAGYSKVHPATRSFQALRMAVNDELPQLELSLPIWIQLLKPGGRLAVITFHSLEDRLVKKALAEQSQPGYDAQLRLLTKKPITATNQELVLNPRSRSAKLRVAAKIKTERVKGSTRAY